MSHVISSPEDYFAEGCSDHAPLAIIFGEKSNGTKEHSLPEFICKHPFFGHKLEQFTEYIKLEQQPDVCQLPVLKMCIKEAARKTRDEMLFNNLEDPAVWKMIISTIVRVLWSNDVRLARKIIYASELANELLEIRLNKVCC